MPTLAPHTDPALLADQIRAGNRTSLARAITLIESQREQDRERAYELLQILMPNLSNAHRIGISGPPGVGKSTLIDAYGLHLIEQGHSVAVLAVDPSSSLSGGSILGDKSRMPRLAQEENAFIRPSPSDLALGGVARRTREAMFLCEAAGFDRVLIETMGVGQSEIQVAGMVDTFLVLIQPGAGDELQGIKKGIVELADVLAVTKADGESVGRAREAVAQYGAALRYLRPKSESWAPKAVSLSALAGDGLSELDGLLGQHREAIAASGELESRRQTDLVQWLGELVEDAVLRRLRQRDGARERLTAAVGEVASGAVSAYRIALDLSRPADS